MLIGPVMQYGLRSDHLRTTLRSEIEDNRRSSDQATRKNYNAFDSLVQQRWPIVQREKLGPWTADNKIYKSFGINSESELKRESKLFLQAIAQSHAQASKKGHTSRQTNPLFWNLRNAFVRGDIAELDKELKYSFQSFILRSKFSQAVTASHMRLADFRLPYEWFPATRMMQRTIHLHVGPTNSGKTYNALKSLENARTGIYCGPLRLLAHEIYTRFTAKGKACALVTGEEQRIPEGVDEYFASCTVEMAPLNKRVDVAVVDEIQMISDDRRGWAWTQAVLGIQAKELHLCGEERTVELIQHLCAMMGDKCIVHRYQRLSPLKTMHESLNGDFTKLQKGDCVVAFSRLGIHKLKGAIEQLTGKRCAIVYGSLPPETRAQQAALFNDPDNDYDFLVASDAIGMGLNLEIKRVIFESATKYDGQNHRQLAVSEIKQIGGRAGRFRTARHEIKSAEAAASTAPSAESAENLASEVKGEPVPAKPTGSVGLVTCLDAEDLPHIQKSFQVDADQLKLAGLLPPAAVIERFYSYFPPGTPFSFVLSRLRELAKLSNSFFLCDPIDMLEIADCIEDIPMAIHDRCVFLTIPVSFREYKQREVLRSLARAVASMTNGHLLDIEDLDLEILDLDKTMVPGPQYLSRLEALHKALTMYLWLSYRYMGVFVSQPLAFHTKSLVEDKITEHLENIGFMPERLKQSREAARRRAENRLDRKKEFLVDDVLGGALDETKHEEDVEEPLMDEVELELEKESAVEVSSKEA